MSRSIPALANSASTLSPSLLSADKLAAGSPVLREGLQGPFRHGVHGEGRRQRLDVERIGRGGIFGFRAGPEETLRTRPEIEDALPAVRGRQGAIRPGMFASPTAIPRGFRSPPAPSLLRRLPRLTNIEATEATLGSSPASMRRWRPRRIRFGRRADTARRENSSVTFTGMPAKIDIFDGRESFRGAGNLDEHVGPFGALM